MRAVVLFACAIFFGCLALIPGDSLWNWAHNAILGLFGGWAVLWPVLMIYVAVITTLDRPTGPLTGKIWLTAVIIVLCCATGYVFGGARPAEGLTFPAYIAFLYQDNSGVGGGLAGGLLGQLLLSAAGSTGAKIIILLLLFVSVMILTGTTLIGLFHTIKKPVEAVSGGIESARQRREEERVILEQDWQASIDVPLDGDPPPRPAPGGDLDSLFVKPEPKKKKPQRNEKLDKLQEVFGIAPEEPPQPEPQPAPEPEPEPEEPAEPQLPMSPVVSENPPLFEPEPEPEPEPAEAEPLDMPKPRMMEPIPMPEPRMQAPEATPAQEFQYQAADPAGAYCFPPLTMLAQSPQVDHAKETEELQSNGKILVDTLNSFGVSTKILDICRGPAVTRYEIQPAAGVKVSKITNLSDDLALNLAATGVRIEAPIPGKAAVGIEVPNRSRSQVCMR